MIIILNNFTQNQFCKTNIHWFDLFVYSVIITKTTAINVTYFKIFDTSDKIMMHKLKYITYRKIKSPTYYYNYQVNVFTMLNRLYLKKYV